MSKLQETLMADMKAAMKEKDTLKKGVINLLRAGLKNDELELKRELTEEEEIKIVQRELKQTKQSLEEAEKANRPDLVESEKAKVTIIEKYLPTQLTPDELKEIIVKLGIEKGTPMGQAIGLVMKEVGGRAEGKVVSSTVKDYLNN